MALLTPEYEKIIRTEKIKRLLLAFVVLLIFAGAIGVVLMLSSYFAAAFSKDAVLQRLQAAEDILEKKDFKRIEEQVEKINEIIAVFEKNESARRAAAPLLMKIANITPASVKFESLKLAAKEDAAILTLTGVATTREIFLDFVEKLKKLDEMESVSSPVKNLLKETDVVFALEARIKKEIYGYAPNQ